ncbi:MAG: pirin-like C-terminal cupin domain-containing protein, partial [Nitrospirales bacterium]
PAHGSFRQSVPSGHSAFAYVFEGEGAFVVDEGQDWVSSPKLVVLDEGNHVKVVTEGEPVRLLLISAQPLHEPIARYGPFVMNTQEEIQQALSDLKRGTFIWTEGKP